MIQFKNTFPLGSCFLGNGQRAFTLRAPLLKQAAAHLVAPEDRLIPMTRDERGYNLFARETYCVAGGHAG
ncbi:MAG TPA: hypothetical protein P5326_11895 [Candidatus Contendobacter sp.]|nr:hypothetical protein [Candidatus Contendobacter sp.]HRZ24728.1 hypothetical protein [Candidatus Contendobacter sp.]